MALLKYAIGRSGFTITEVVSGGASGVDRLSERWAKDHKIPIEVIRADWSRFGKNAGPIRNAQIIENAQAMIAVWDGLSRGTADSIARAEAKRIDTFVAQFTRIGDRWCLCRTDRSDAASPVERIPS